MIYVQLELGAYSVLGKPEVLIQPLGLSNI